eukprot:m.77702 g.77702  ORF g.77702 m.77702 type:complete len:664 (-) comp14714_c0_seq1:733-2724(-)
MAEKLSRAEADALLRQVWTLSRPAVTLRVLASAPAKLYLTDAAGNDWSVLGSGVAGLVAEGDSKEVRLAHVSLGQAGWPSSILLNEPLSDNMRYRVDEEKPYFHHFFLRRKAAGLHFARPPEAQTFLEVLRFSMDTMIARKAALTTQAQVRASQSSPAPPSAGATATPSVASTPPPCRAAIPAATAAAAMHSAPPESSGQRSASVPSARSLKDLAPPLPPMPASASASVAASGNDDGSASSNSTSNSNSSSGISSSSSSSDSSSAASVKLVRSGSVRAAVQAFQQQSRAPEEDCGRARSGTVPARSLQAAARSAHSAGSQQQQDQNHYHHTPLSRSVHSHSSSHIELKESSEQQQQQEWERDHHLQMPRPLAGSQSQSLQSLNLPMLPPPPAGPKHSGFAARQTVTLPKATPAPFTSPGPTRRGLFDGSGGGSGSSHNVGGMGSNGSLMRAGSFTTLALPPPLPPPPRSPSGSELSFRSPGSSTGSISDLTHIGTPGDDLAFVHSLMHPTPLMHPIITNISDYSREASLNPTPNPSTVLMAGSESRSGSAAPPALPPPPVAGGATLSAASAAAIAVPPSSPKPAQAAFSAATPHTASADPGTPSTLRRAASFSVSGRSIKRDTTPRPPPPAPPGQETPQKPGDVIRAQSSPSILRRDCSTVVE